MKNRNHEENELIKTWLSFAFENLLASFVQKRIIFENENFDFSREEK
jgi:hypothetical protein